MTAGILHAVAFLVGAPALGVLAVAARDAHRRRRRDNELCACIHTRTAHQHYRAGDECVQCSCPGFVPAVRLAPVADRAGRPDDAAECVS